MQCAGLLPTTATTTTINTTIIELHYYYYYCYTTTNTTTTHYTNNRDDMESALHCKYRIAYLSTLLSGFGGKPALVGRAKVRNLHRRHLCRRQGLLCTTAPTGTQDTHPRTTKQKQDKKKCDHNVTATHGQGNCY